MNWGLAWGLFSVGINVALLVFSFLYAKRFRQPHALLLVTGMTLRVLGGAFNAYFKYFVYPTMEGTGAERHFPILIAANVSFVGFILFALGFCLLIRKILQERPA